MSRLERRYRRLLSWYPRDHRAAHEDEMLGVLLALGRPSLRDTWDLALGGVRIRIRRAFGPGSADSWRDALANATVIASLVFAADALARSAAFNVIALFEPPFFLLGAVPYALVAVLVLRGLRLPAALVVWTWTGYLAYGTAESLTSVPVSLVLLPMATQLTPRILLAVLVTLTPGQAAAAARLGGRRLLTWTTACAALMIPVYLSSMIILPLFHWDVLAAVVPLTIAALAAAWFAHTPTGVRTVVLLAPAVIPVLGLPVFMGLYVGQWLAGPLALLLPMLALLAARRVRLRRA